MDMTVRQRALAIEQGARRYDPATAVNVLAVRVAQLEALLAVADQTAECLRAQLPDPGPHVGAGNGPVG